MQKWSRWVFSIGLWFLPLCTSAHATQWQLQVGEMRVLQLSNVARVAVGDGHVLNAVTSDDKEVLVFARNSGSSSLTVWFEEGTHQTYQVQVTEAEQQHAITELKQLLQRIPQLRVTEVGETVVVEGEQLSAQHRQQLEELKQRYSQIVDLSSSMPWEPMVLLDVQVLELPRNFMRELGVQWSEQSEGGINAGIAWDGSSRRLADRPGEVVMPMPYQKGAVSSYFGLNALLSARVQALTQTGQAVVLAQPQLLARSGSTAEFLAGGEVPYTTTDNNGNNNTSFKSYGVSLEITPFLESNGAVRSHVDVEVSSIDPSLSIPAGPSLKTRRASTEFNVQSGQTLVLAGFMSKEIAENTSQLPGMGDVPILGRLFKSKRYQRNETELAIFVTPKLVDANDQGVQERARRAQHITNDAFEAPVLNVPVGTSAPTSTNASASSTSSSRYWDPWGVDGSQWQDEQPKKGGNDESAS